MRDDHQRLRDILEAIERIEKYASRGRDAFFEEDWMQVWVVHHLQIIGESARALSDAMRERCGDQPWRQFIGMRHILVHQYFAIDLDLVWEVVERDLPLLRAAIEQEL